MLGDQQQQQPLRANHGGPPRPAAIPGRGTLNKRSVGYSADYVSCDDTCLGRLLVAFACPLGTVAKGKQCMLIWPEAPGRGGKREQTWRAGNASRDGDVEMGRGLQKRFRLMRQRGMDIGDGRGRDGAARTKHQIIPHRHYRHSGHRQNIVEDEDSDLEIHLAESRSQVNAVSLPRLDTSSLPNNSSTLKISNPPCPTHT